VVQPRPKRPPFQDPHAPGIIVPPHVSLQPEVPENDEWQEIVHPTVSQDRGWPNLSLPSPPPVNQIVQAAPVHSPVQSSHARKRLKTKAHHAPNKGKSIVAPSSPSNDFSHVINEIRPKGSTQPKANLERSKGDNSNKGKIASQSGKYGF
jgi:hypothetical protein